MIMTILLDFYAPANIKLVGRSPKLVKAAINWYNKTCLNLGMHKLVLRPHILHVIYLPTHICQESYVTRIQYTAQQLSTLHII